MEPHRQTTSRSPRGYRPIEDYAAIGDAQSVALVASDGGIDWVCFPYIDSAAVLCRLLDDEKGGYIAVHPAAPHPDAVVERRYRDRSNVLETVLRATDGSLRLTDTMPIAKDDPTPLDAQYSGHSRHRIIRMIEAIDRSVATAVEARLGFDFAATPANVTLLPGQGALAHDGADRWLAFAWPGELAVGTDGLLRGEITVHLGTPLFCVLAFATSEAEARSLLDGEVWRDQLEATDVAWRNWAMGMRVSGPYADAMLRSALVLKLLTFEPTGALVAAPTTSLPELIGGVRNWDYRYCWLRDATFTLYAFLLLGDHSAARAFWSWMVRVCGETDPADLQIMFSVHGASELPERTLDHLDGYRASQPVRVGNAAHGQRQLDVYGELLDAYWLYHQFLHAMDATPAVTDRLWTLLGRIADYICDVWRQPDQGIWEARSEPRHYVYSKVMCWVGLDRAVRLAESVPGLMRGDRRRWAAQRDAIHRDVLTHGYKSTVGAFTMAYDGEDLDAAVLRLPLVGFLPATDSRMRSTIERVRAELSFDGLIRRYQHATDDGLPPGEGAFAICSFWLVDCLVAGGDIEEAKTLFDRMVDFGNDLGLFAEEIDPRTGAALGNFPQAFTHLALIDAGVDLTEALLRQPPREGSAADRAVQMRRDGPSNAKSAASRPSS